MDRSICLVRKVGMRAANYNLFLKQLPEVYYLL